MRKSRLATRIAPVLLFIGSLFACDTASAFWFYRIPTITDVAVRVNRYTGEFSTLLAALNAAGIDLNQIGQKTVFAPTDAAFAKIGLNKDNVGNTPGLGNILAYHVAPRRYYLRSWLRPTQVPSLLGPSLSFTRYRSRLMVNNAYIIAGLPLRDGNLYIINEVLLPPAPAPAN